MADHRARFGPHNPDETYVAHTFAEQLVALGEMEMNYATAGDPLSPLDALRTNTERLFPRLERA
jgi:hypothetical protein